MSGMSKFFNSVFIISLLALFSGCSKLGDSLGIDIPEDNIIDEQINKTIYYPIRDQICSWGFRTSGCIEENTTTNVIDKNNSNDTNNSITCPSGYTLTDGTCVDSSGSKLKDVVSKWFDILTIKQQQVVKEDKNNINSNNKDLTAITLIDNLTNGKLLMKKNTKIVLPYYIYNTKVESQIAITGSSNISKVKPVLIDSPNGTFKIVDSNSIVFLELSALGAVGDSASINLKVQEMDASKYDEEDLNVSIVDDNSTYTYNPVSLFFTYKTIIIEEDDSRNIYFGISYTIDSNVTVAVRSEIEKITSGTGTTLDLTTSVNNNIVQAFISNENGVPFYFRIDAKGKAGDTMKLYLVARDSQGTFDFQEFNVLIVEKGQGNYTSDTNGTDNNGSDSNTSQILIGNDFETLSDADKLLVIADNNRHDPTSSTKPIITFFESNKQPIQIPKGKTISTSFYVKDQDNGSIYTTIYDDINKVKANMIGYGKYTVTYSNKLFYMTLEAVGNVGDESNITIYSQNQNDLTQYDQESFRVQIVDANSTGTNIAPKIAFGIKILYIEEGSYRDGLAFYTTSGSNAIATVSVTNENVAKFLGFNKESIGYYQFGIKAIGKSGTQTSLSIQLTENGLNAESVAIPVYIVGTGKLNDYINNEQNGTGNGNGTISCDIGYTAVHGICVQDTNNTTDNNTTQTCQTGYHLVGRNCVQDTNNTTDNNTTQTCQTGYHLVGTNCVQDTNNTTDNNTTDNNQTICPTGTYLDKINGQCVSLNGDTNVTPSCSTGYHLSDGQCVPDTVNPTCQTGYHLSNGTCISDTNNSIIPPICNVGYKLQNGMCVENPVCNDGYHLENGSCIIDVVTCGTGFTEVNGTCIKNETNTTEDRNTSNIPYEEWSDTEKAKKSIEICFLKITETGYVSLNAQTILAEGYTNSAGTIVLHSQKASVINGVSQNVSITMVYKEIATAKSTNKFLDATYTLPKFRIDYTVDYANSTFYVINNGDGKCYINTFPADGSIPFGILELVKPADLPMN